jgi:uncharacterized protein YjiK
MAIAKEKIIAKIPEASGICFYTPSKTLFVVSDEGTIYEITKKGKIKREKYLGDYDLEGVACDAEKGLLYLAVEVNDSVLVVDAKSFKIIKEVPIKRDFEGVKVLKKDKEYGLEAIELIDGTLYLSNQSYKQWPSDDPSVVFSIDSLENKKAKITKVFRHGYVDIAALSYHKNMLYMISDKKNLLIIYDLKKERTIKTHKLAKSAQEGLCFDDKGKMYIADDKGKIIKMDEP